MRLQWNFVTLTAHQIGVISNVEGKIPRQKPDKDRRIRPRAQRVTVTIKTSLFNKDSFHCLPFATAYLCGRP